MYRVVKPGLPQHEERPLDANETPKTKTAAEDQPSWLGGMHVTGKAVVSDKYGSAFLVDADRGTYRPLVRES
jgi:hypothetical protein